MRVNRFKNMAEAFQVPESTANQYYFDPKIVTIGKPKFNTVATHQRISTDEFMDLRGRVIQRVQKGLCFAKFLYYFRFIVAALSLGWTAIRISFQYTGGIHISRQEYWIILAIIIVPNLLANYLWRKVSRKLSTQVQAALDEENSNIYNSRGITWKINPNLHYMQISLRNDARYQPPHHQGNSIQNYPINYRPESAPANPPVQNNSGFAEYRGIPAARNNEAPVVINSNPLVIHNYQRNDSQGLGSRQQLIGRNLAPQVTYDYRVVAQGQGQGEGDPQVHFNH